MPEPLTLTLIVVLIVLSLGMLATLLQLRHTARKFEAFLAATQQDLHAITTDVHAFRLHLEQLITPLRSTTADLAEFAKALGDLATGVRQIQSRVQRGLAMAGGYWSGLMKGVTTLLPFVK